jgi:hypothetical protein
VSENEIAYLFDLIRLGFVTLWLKIQNFCDAFSSEDVVTAVDSQNKLKINENAAQLFKTNRVIRTSKDDFLEQFLPLTHP